MSNELEVEKLRRVHQRLRLWAIISSLAAAVMGICLAGGLAYGALLMANNPTFFGRASTPTPVFPYFFPTAAPFRAQPPTLYYPMPVTPPPAPTPAPYPAYRLTEVPFVNLPVPVGPNVTTVDILSGTGHLSLQPSEYRLFRFEIKGLAAADAVDDAELHLTAGEETPNSQLMLYLISPITGRPSRFFLAPGTTKIESPTLLFLPAYEVYAVIANFDLQPASIENLSLALTVHTPAGITQTYPPGARLAPPASPTP